MVDPPALQPIPTIEKTPVSAAAVEDELRQLVANVEDYAILLLDEHGNLLNWNRGAELISGYPQSEAIGRHVSMLYPPSATRSGWPESELLVARDSGRFEDEGWRVRKDGDQFWASVAVTPLRRRDGTLRGYLEIVRDLTERKHAEQELRRSEERVRLLVESVKDYAIFMLDPEGYVSSWNEGARAIKGYQADEILGRHFSIFYPDDARWQKWPDQELEFARMRGRFEDEGWRVRKNGSRFWANVVITALRDSDGKLIGFAKITRDLTERRNAEEALRHAHADLEQRVRERTADLARVNQELAEAGQVKDEFIAVLAHELRNPLAPILNSLELMRLAGHDPATMTRARQVIDRQVQHMVRYVDDLMDVSRIGRRTLELRKERIELAVVVQRALESVSPSLEEARHRIDVDLPAEPVVLDADPIRLSQVLSNLLQNAIKYTEPGGHIHLSAATHGSEVEIRLEDDGMGIPPELLPHVFEEFRQGDYVPARAQRGLGIGLALVRYLTEMHGGRVEAYSSGPNQGSTFTLHLPLPAKPVPTDERVREATATTTRRRILVADDNEDTASSLGMILELMGSEVTVAHDGRSALEGAERFRPEIAVLDIGMPQMDGYEVARRIREQPWGKSMILIALTGWGQDQDRRESEAAGFDHHLIKPVSPPDLMELVNRLAQTTAG